MSLIDLHGLSNRLWPWASQSPNLLPMPHFAHLQNGVNRSSQVVVRIRWAHLWEALRPLLSGSEWQAGTTCSEYSKPFVDRRHALTSFGHTIKGPALSTSSLFNEWIKCVLFVLSLNAQTNKFGLSFPKEMSLGLNCVLGTFLFFPGPRSLSVYLK